MAEVGVRSFMYCAGRLSLACAPTISLQPVLFSRRYCSTRYSTMTTYELKNYTSLALIAVPSLLLAASILTAPPQSPTSAKIYPSLSSLPSEVAKRVNAVYPEDLYEGGSYVSFPRGRVSTQALEDSHRRRLTRVVELRIGTVLDYRAGEWTTGMLVTCWSTSDCESSYPVNN